MSEHVSSRRVVVAMSGGVDSSVAAALLHKQGYDVIGVMMRLWAEEDNRCCAAEAEVDARIVADRLGIPFYVVNYESEFRECVVDSFIAEYVRGRTPNPCLACNRHLRFGRLLRHAETLGAAHLATGHYAQVRRAAGGLSLRKGVDPTKDQSYVLYMLDQDTLSRVLFPIGGYTKQQVRGMAWQMGLPVADRDESMDLCFVSNGDYRSFLRRHAPGAMTSGPILDTSGRQIGWHRGLALYTIGQRKGLKLASSEALYVIRLDRERNAVIAGPARALGRTQLVAESVHYVSGSAPDQPLHVEVKTRYKASPISALWTPLEGGRAQVELDVPARDITPGQAAVAYEGDMVRAGGIISE